MAVYGDARDAHAEPFLALSMFVCAVLNEAFRPGGLSTVAEASGDHALRKPVFTEKGFSDAPPLLMTSSGKAASLVLQSCPSNSHRRYLGGRSKDEEPIDACVGSAKAMNVSEEKNGR